MAWTKQTKAARLLARFEAAIMKKEDTRQIYNALPGNVDSATFTQALEEKQAAERRFNMLRGTLFRTIMQSTEEL